MVDKHILKNIRCILFDVYIDAIKTIIPSINTKI